MASRYSMAKNVKQNISVSIIIPNWNGAKLLRKYLPKVLEAANGAEVIIVDDCSTDDSVEVVKANFPTVKIIIKESNSGFAKSVNVGVQQSQGDVVVLLNTDVVPENGFLIPLLSHFSDPNLFAVGCMEKNTEKDGVVMRGRSIAHWQKGFYIHARGEVNKTDTAWASGGSAAFRKSLWIKFHGMDTIFNPFYWEDIDLSYRASKAGYSIVFEPLSIVWHFHEQGSIKTQFQKDKVSRVVYRNQFIFIWKNVTDPMLFLEHLLWAPIRIIQECLKGDTTMFFGFLLAMGKIPQILRQRGDHEFIWKRRDVSMGVY